MEKSTKTKEFCLLYIKKYNRMCLLLTFFMFYMGQQLSRVIVPYRSDNLSQTHKSYFNESFFERIKLHFEQKAIQCITIGSTNLHDNSIQITLLYF